MTIITRQVMCNTIIGALLYETYHNLPNINKTIGENCLLKNNTLHTKETHLKNSLQCTPLQVREN